MGGGRRRALRRPGPRGGPGPGRPGRWRGRGPASAATASPAAAGSGRSAAAGLKEILYQGYTFEVPRSWPVVDEALHPGTCVRFDQHVVYLGRPGPDQSCPSWLFGTTEAVLIESGPAGAPRSSVENRLPGRSP